MHLLLQGQCVVSKANQIKLDWNYNVANGMLTCYEGGQLFIQNNIAGTGVILNGKNTMYDCQISGVYAGETVLSNRVVIYPDNTQPIVQNGNDTLIKENVYVEESRAGMSYFINAKQNNTKDA